MNPAKVGNGNADKIKLASASITSASLSGSNVVLKTSGDNLTVKIARKVSKANTLIGDKDYQLND